MPETAVPETATDADVPQAVGPVAGAAGDEAVGAAPAGLPARRTLGAPPVPTRPVIRGLPVTPPPPPGHQQPFPVRRVESVGASDRMLALCGWATTLGLLGTLAAVRGLFAIRAGTAPDWYEPTLAAVGLAGVSCTVGAFTLVRRARLPWLLLGLATVPLLVNVGLTVGAL